MADGVDQASGPLASLRLPMLAVPSAIGLVVRAVYGRFMDFTNRTPLVSLHFKRNERNLVKTGSFAVSTQQIHFDFIALPLEIRLLVYSYCQLSAKFTITHNTLVKYFRGQPTEICGLVDASKWLRAEAFQAVLHQNAIDLIGLKQKAALIRYIDRTQIAGFSFWRSIRRVRLSVKTDNTLHAAGKLLPLCTKLEVLQLEITRELDKHRKACALRHNLTFKLYELCLVIESLPKLRRMSITADESGYLHAWDAWTVQEKSSIGYPDKPRFKWVHTRTPIVKHAATT